MAHKPFGRTRTNQKPRRSKNAPKPVTTPLQAGDRVCVGEASGSVVKTELFSDEDAIEFVRFDNSTGDLVAIPRELLELLPEDFCYGC